MLVSDTRSGNLNGLQELVQQSELSGAKRHAALLHIDRLPPPLTKPHHVRLARQAVHGLLDADRAQMFDLPYGRVAIVWRNGGRTELAQVREALAHLIGGEDTTVPDKLLSFYNLPDQAVRFLDQLASGPEPTAPPAAKCAPLDLTLLARLEAGLAQADLSRFTRRRMVMSWGNDTNPHPKLNAGCVAWEERLLAHDELAAGLCPDRDIGSDPWLFRRLTRILDRRMLVALSVGRELMGCHAYAIDLNISSILSREFLRFDEALPVTLRGQMIINLTAADILSDFSSFVFARKFAHARQYRLALADGTLAMLDLIDPRAAGLDLVKITVCPDVQAAPWRLALLVPSSMPVVLMGLNRPSELRWAKCHGFTYGQGQAFSS